MPNIILDQKSFAKRSNEIRELLRPLVPKANTGAPACNTQRGSNQVVYFAHDAVTESHYRDMRFRTFLADFKANYFEVWKPLDSSKYDSWYLEKAYLQIYQIMRSTTHDEKEYICLHTDPEEQGEPNSKYKQSPHFHIKVANDDTISKAHLAISGICIDSIVKSNKDLFDTMKHGIEIICDEILSRIQ